MIRKFITLVTLAVFLWLLWSFSGRNTPLNEPKSYISVIEEINPSDSLKRNIVGIQPYMEVSDYFSQIIFKEKIRQYLVAANGKSFIKKNTLVIYPEHIGTWLLLLDEKHNLAEKKTLSEAMRIIAFSNAFDFFLGYLKTSDEANTEISSIIRMKAKSMLRVYFETFRDLAIETGTHIVAGSILLPEPSVVDGEIYLKLDGPLYNASFLFGPDGKVVGTPILKSFPNSTEDSYTSAGDPTKSQVFDLPFGRTVIMLCDDSWHNQTYENAINDAAEIIVGSSFYAGNQTMNSKWTGYDGKTSPKNLDLEDVGKLSTKEAWEKYSLPEQIKHTKADVAFNVFFRGDLWDLGPAGQPLVVLNNKSLPITPAGKGGIWSLNY
ncbi:nitrilase-related carbon-nitrogen hydrolase [Algoriphagus sp. C2-6-M1]|uniref:nitrilase-related carbon-nitrogen hydrolase n=1 Tax=Algoriphagus persicinus TaxID=3108754 RepID=UPI002B3C9F7D|nr:nitrilase-related carbon-nitrogen hydrolase [Algoriphagus sp. C2-6-M1]MEB2779838.1 nitrilase-related carbon-nitrogen hydrolase [Algoriphagus sp. C2-6-M1]